MACNESETIGLVSRVRTASQTKYPEGEEAEAQEGKLQRASVAIIAGYRFALRVLKRTIAADLSTTPTTIDYHLVIYGFASEIFHRVLIIVSVASTIKLPPFPSPADHSRRVEGSGAGGRLERHSQTEGQRR